MQDENAANGRKPIDTHDFFDRCPLKSEEVVKCPKGTYQTGDSVLGCGDHERRGCKAQYIRQDETATIGRIPVGSENLSMTFRADGDIDFHVLQGGRCIIGYGCMYAQKCDEAFSSEVRVRSGWRCHEYRGQRFYFSGDDTENPVEESFSVDEVKGEPLVLAVKGYANGDAAAYYEFDKLVGCTAEMPLGCASCRENTQCESPLMPVCDGSKVVRCEVLFEADKWYTMRFLNQETYIEGGGGEGHVYHVLQVDKNGVKLYDHNTQEELHIAKLDITDITDIKPAKKPKTAAPTRAPTPQPTAQPTAEPTLAPEPADMRMPFAVTFMVLLILSYCVFRWSKYGAYYNLRELRIVEKDNVNRKLQKVPIHPESAIRRDLKLLDCPSQKGWFVVGRDTSRCQDVICKCGGGHHQLRKVELIQVVKDQKLDPVAFMAFAEEKRITFDNQNVFDLVHAYLETDLYLHGFVSSREDVRQMFADYEENVSEVKRQNDYLLLDRDCCCD